jgi:hypothetical protein
MQYLRTLEFLLALINSINNIRMFKKKGFLLVFLIVSITLPMFISFAQSLSAKDVEDKSCLTVFLNMTEEESKDDENPFEKEKNINVISFNISPYTSILKTEKYFNNILKAITGNPALHFTPPELS